MNDEKEKSGLASSLMRGIVVILLVVAAIFVAKFLFSPTETSVPVSSSTQSAPASSAKTYSGSTSGTSGKSYSASEIAETLQRGLDKDANGVTYDVYAVGTTLIEVDVTIPGASTIAKKAMAGDKDTWTDTVAAVNDLASNLKSSVDKTGRTDISVSVMLLNDQDPDMMLINSLDGSTLYDYVNGIDVLDE